MEQTAVIKETLRLASPTPAGLPRVVPPPGTVISGVRIPGGVRISRTYSFCPWLMPLADSREPERPFRVVFRGGLPSAVRVSSRPLASARLQASRELARKFLKRTAQLPRHQVSD